VIDPSFAYQDISPSGISDNASADGSKLHPSFDGTQKLRATKKKPVKLNAGTNYTNIRKFLKSTIKQQL